MSIDLLINKIAKTKSRILTIKQKIATISNNSNFNEILKKIENKIENSKNNINLQSESNSKNKLISNKSVQMPKITFLEQNKKEKDNNLNTTNPKIGSMILEKSKRYEIDPLLISAIMAIESDYNHNVISDKGAIGLMQIMPETAQLLGIDPYDMNQNIEGGIKYFKQMLEKFSGDVKLALAAYNAGPNAVLKHNGIPPYPETQNYVLKVLKKYEEFLKQRDKNNNITEIDEIYVKK